MGDPRVMSSSASSFSIFLSGSLRARDKGLCFRDQQLGTGRSGLETCRILTVNATRKRVFQCGALLDDQRFPFGLRTNEIESTSRDEDLSVFDRLALAWKVLFPRRKKISSPAEIAKQRLKMILISDRCSVNDNAKRKIVNNIVGALADFVEIESQDRVQLNVCADPDLGTVYSVSVPVRRVKPEFQGNDSDIMDDQLSREASSEFEGSFELSEVNNSKEVKLQESEEAFKLPELEDAES